MTDLSEAKTALRKVMRNKRRKLAAEAPNAGAAIRDHFVAAFPRETGTAVSGYWPMGDEADGRLLLSYLHSIGWSCMLPVVTAAGMALTFRQWEPGDLLIESSIGIQEPGDDAPEDRPDILLVPLLAFDEKGFRLGQGGGYYDRTLGALREETDDVLAVGIAFAGQQVDTVPRDAFDQPLDWVVTEAGATRF